MKIRKAKKEDLKQLAKLVLDLHKLHSHFDKRFKLKPDAVCLKLIERDLRKYFKKPKTRIILVCEEENKVLGFVDFWIEEKECNVQDKGIWIYEVYVDRKYRNKGIAKELVKEVAQIAKKKGIKDLDFTYIPKNQQSTNFWKSLKTKTWSLNAVIKVKDVLQIKNICQRLLFIIILKKMPGVGF